MVDAVRSKKLIESELRLEFSRGSDAPMLWVPDAVAGAVGAMLKGGDPDPALILGEFMVEQHVRLV